MTDSVEVGPTVAQGSIGGGLISSCNLDYSVNKFFQRSTSEAHYHNLKLQPLIYQDDLGRFSNSISDAQDGTAKIEAVMETNILDLHEDKSCFILFGNTIQKKKAHEELLKNPIKLYGKSMKEKRKEKYLGDFIDGNGNKASVEATVTDRYGRILDGTFQIRQVVEDCRSNALGGIKAGVELWEIVYIPSLLNNCQTWVEIGNDTIDKLEELQNTFFRSLLSVPRTTPKPALIWELGCLKMKWRIIQQKLIFMNHILHLEPESLAWQVQEIEDKENLPGLTQECKEQIEKLNLPSIFKVNIPKLTWNKIVKKAIEKANENEIRETMMTYKKLKNRKIVSDRYGMKEYAKTLYLHEARLIFKHRTSMTQYVKLNYKGNKRYEAEGWKCDDCLHLDSEDHLLWCEEYESIRENLNLEKDKDLSLYLHKIHISRGKKNSKHVRTFP